ncbi:zinc finger protein 62 homolog [Folsomia candida]|uniref:zinc finger protein 62 homolog n=1 Tax=Folsomia candida TaxID=158441 RepID=UPI001604F8B5|nr:zinc finger protein 62 homolog [Folsomia candida]
MHHLLLIIFKYFIVENEQGKIASKSLSPVITEHVAMMGGGQPDEDFLAIGKNMNSSDDNSKHRPEYYPTDMDPSSSSDDEELVVQTTRARTKKRVLFKRQRRDHEPSRGLIKDKTTSSVNNDINKSSSTSEESDETYIDVWSYCLSNFGLQPQQMHKKLILERLLSISNYLEYQLDEKTNRLNEYMQIPSTSPESCDRSSTSFQGPSTSNGPRSINTGGQLKKRIFLASKSQIQKVEKLKKEQVKESSVFKECECAHCTYNQERGNRAKKTGHMCTICSKCFSTTQHLRRHMSVHSNERPFVCMYEGCGVKFKSQEIQLIHQKIHETGERPLNQQTISSQTEIGEMIFACDDMKKVVCRPMTKQDKQDDDLRRIYFIPVEQDDVQVEKTLNYTNLSDIKVRARQMKKKVIRGLASEYIDAERGCVVRHVVKQGMEWEVEKAVAFPHLYKGRRLAKRAKTWHRLRLGSIGNSAELEAIPLFKEFFSQLEEQVQLHADLFDEKTADMVRSRVLPDAFNGGHIQMTTTVPLSDILNY